MKYIIIFLLLISIDNCLSEKETKDKRCLFDKETKQNKCKYKTIKDLFTF